MVVCTFKSSLVSIRHLTVSLNSKNAKWPFSLSHNRLQTGGWARQQNGMLCLWGLIDEVSHLASLVNVMPVATGKVDQE